MPARYLVEFILLAALWGASFLFMRIASSEFGAIPLSGVRVSVACLALLPFLYYRRGMRAFVVHAKPIFLVGLCNTAIPYTLFAYAALHLHAGFTAIINSTAPLWTALLAFVVLGARVTLTGLTGLLLGFLGVVVLISNTLSINLTAIAWDGASSAIAAAMMATLLYAVAAILTKEKLQGVDPLAISTGSLFFSSLIILPLAVIQWPSAPISVSSWAAVIAMGVACTALALVLYFRLVNQLGPSNAITVTYLIPVFGMLFGELFLDEAITVAMLVGGALILFGTALTMRLIRLPKWRPQGE